MTTATKTRPTRSREEELAEQLEQHRSTIAALEQQASDWDRAADELDAHAEARITDFEGPVNELPKGVDEDRGKAQLKRQGAADLRKRAEAYAARVELPAIAAEHTQLREERIANEQLEAATEEARALIAEIENRSAWLYRNVIADRAVERRVIEAVERLTKLQAQHRLPIDLGYHLRLAGDAVALAGQYVNWINSHLDENLWRQTLPALEALELPVELRAPMAAAADPATDQLTRKPFDPNLPKDRAMRLAAASTSMSRNADGTLSAGSVQSPFGGNSSGAAMPRTEAEDRAARRRVAAELEDGA